MTERFQLRASTPGPAYEISFSLLVDRPEAIPTVAMWYFDDQGHKIEGNSFEKTCERIRTKLNRQNPPMHVLAYHGESLAGVAQWKRHEMAEFPEKEHWLGSLFVAPEHRGKGVAFQLALRVSEVAKSFGVSELFLSTEDLTGGVYARAGWIPLERVTSRGDEVLVMVKRLDV